MLDEPELEFGERLRHIDPRTGLRDFGPADLDSETRPSVINVGLVGEVKDVRELRAWLEQCANGVQGKATHQRNLFPAFPGCDAEAGFRADLRFDSDLTREVPKRRVRSLQALSGSAATKGAVDLIVGEVQVLLEKARADVVMVVRPDWLEDDGVDDEDDEDDAAVVGFNFRDVLKARSMHLGVPLQVIRPSTWDPKRARARDSRTGEPRKLQDEATRAWNLFAALYYKAKGKPWRLPRNSQDASVCFVGVSFFRTQRGDHLHTAVAQVFNERGDGVIVRGAQATISKDDRQPHLSRADAAALLVAALDRYRDEHDTLPARLVLHKSSAFDEEETAGFSDVAEMRELSQLELVWIPSREGTMLFRTAGPNPPLRGTLISMDDDHHALYTRGSIPFYRTYPGMHVPHALGIRPHLIERTLEQIAAEVLALTKMNWNQTQLDGLLPITLRTARRVGEVLRHVAPGTPIATRYAFYM